MSDKQDDFDDEFLPDEQELRKNLQKLNREIKRLKTEFEKDLMTAEKINKARLENQEMWYENQLSSLREQIKMILEKNMELGEACKVFAKGVENLKKDGIVTTRTTTWERKGAQGLDITISRLVLDGKRIKTIFPTRVDHHGYTIEAMIVTEHIEKYKKSM
jgi:hypothetical protein